MRTKPPHAASLLATYRRQASNYAVMRAKTLFERKWLDRFSELIPAEGRILDIGCGTGEPIARYFMEMGYRVTGVDFAPEMVSIARDRWPDGDWRVLDMREISTGEAFDGVLAWNSLIHLTWDEQRRALPKILEQATATGAFMATVGPEEGEAWGDVGGEPVYHASLSAGEYGEILARHGFGLLEFARNDPDCAGHTILLASRSVREMRAATG